MSMVKAKKALGEIREHYITAKSDPVMWNLSLALEEIAKSIERQDAILEELQRRR